jgi:hypothetical protein
MVRNKHSSNLFWGGGGGYPYFQSLKDSDMRPTGGSSVLQFILMMTITTVAAATKASIFRNAASPRCYSQYRYIRCSVTFEV